MLPILVNIHCLLATGHQICVFFTSEPQLSTKVVKMLLPLRKYSNKLQRARQILLKVCTPWGWQLKYYIQISSGFRRALR